MTNARPMHHPPVHDQPSRDRHTSHLPVKDQLAVKDQPVGDLRASDADRDSVVEHLHTAFASGRLTDAELEERLHHALAARTVAELVPLTADLPVEQASRAPAPRRPNVDLLRAAWAAWALAVTINLVIWASVTLGTRELVYFWPVWVAGPWGAVLLVRTLAPASAVPWGGCAARPRRS